MSPESSRQAPPLPPVHLARRVGCSPTDPLEGYEESGRITRSELLGLLPEDWSFEDRRVLDFGCGAGRALRHFLDEAETAEFHGCDIDVESIEWMRGNLSPPLHPFLNGEDPPLDRPDGFFDLIWAQSVFTHLTENWSAWLLEMHRVLKPDGLLIASFCGPGMLPGLWDDDRFGMNMVHEGLSWELGGPLVFHSEWWLREHWGRAFEILELRNSGYQYPDDRSLGHGVVLARRKDVELTPADLERIDPSEPREISALQNNVAQLRDEVRALRAAEDEVRAQGRSEGANQAATAFEQTFSWRLTRPIRRVRSLIGGSGGTDGR